MTDCKIILRYQLKKGWDVTFFRGMIGFSVLRLMELEIETDPDDIPAAFDLGILALEGTGAAQLRPKLHSEAHIRQQCGRCLVHKMGRDPWHRSIGSPARWSGSTRTQHRFEKRA
jgi:hypothetical protein